jgi:hypothetical protein
VPVNLRPDSQAAPLWVEDADYEALVRRNAGGWSACADETEWLAKLHYLRAGFAEGKLEASAFEEREMRLVQAWLRRRL